ncbi:MAG: S8 family serine peptidase, partial [Gemmatimonadaceae bacterium]
MSNETNRVLIKLRPSNGLRAAESRIPMRPLYENSPSRQVMGIDASPQWYLAELSGGNATPWDLAHDRIADQLGIAESDVIFAEPDLVHDAFLDDGDRAVSSGMAVGEECADTPQDGKDGKKMGQGFAWHLGSQFTQLADARNDSKFAARRTRIAHIDTGYFGAHVTTPVNIRHDLERNFVDKDMDRTSAEDPNNKVLVLDNSGHGTGTISVLAGNKFNGIELGGAFDADIVPLRIADSVMLLHTSAFAEAVNYATDIQCDVATMSMGGLPSRAWREAIDRAYMEGLFIVAAAGNNVHSLPTKHIVYPARYARVLAACGVMNDGSPYDGIGAMQGNFGPDSCMETAMATYTPNIPWAVYGCKDNVRLNGEGTSAATPQLAAAAALWIEKYKDVLPRDWRRVEAARNALFMSAARNDQLKGRLGRGILRAMDALAIKPDLNLKQSKSDGDSFAFLRVITGLGITEIPTREDMFNMELMQRYLMSAELQRLVPDPEAIQQLDQKTLAAFMGAIIEDKKASLALRRHVASRYPVAAGKQFVPGVDIQEVVPVVRPACGDPLQLDRPPYRRLRAYALDPSLSNRLDTASINEVTLQIRWEDLQKAGPDGEYLNVVDKDPTGVEYKGVVLDDPRLLAQDGWAPSEGNPQFHQQMVYAVAMRTIERFEQALGRPVMWRARPDKTGDPDKSTFVQQLEVRPHALRQANAYYSPADIALLFGYFEASADDPSDHVPGAHIYACLSHDIVAHETTHAILDGMHERFNDPSNPDVLALHEGFADIVALLQHMSLPELLESEIAKVRGDIEAESMLGSLALQFGHAIGGRTALRDAIGRKENGVWTRFQPDPEDLNRRLTPHSRGAVLVGAVFDAYTAIYKTRVADLLRLATGGTGILANGAIHPDLVKRLAAEAVKAATHVLNMCIRALDYLPPVDVTFFEYLRAL